jgi:hypothetical protein
MSYIDQNAWSTERMLERSPLLPAALVGGGELGDAPASGFQGSGMDHFVHRENLAHYRRLLAEPNVTNDPVRHERLNQLLAKEIAKGATSPGCFSNSESDSVSKD